MTVTPETAAQWIASLPTATAIDIIADAFELVLLAADEDNGGDDGNGDTVPSDFDCIETVPLPHDHRGFPMMAIYVFDVLDKARAQLAEWADLDRDDLPRTTAAIAHGDHLASIARQEGAA